MKRVFAWMLSLVLCFALAPAAMASETAAHGKLAGKPVITVQPETKTTTSGTTVKFSVTATGAKTYQWYYRTSSGGTWAKSTLTGATTNTLTVKATTARNGYQYKCAVKNAAGTTYSNPVTLKIKPKITVQPVDASVEEDESAVFTVKATGPNLTYQWQYRSSDSESWKDSKASGAKTATLTVRGDLAYSGFQHRCRVTNANGTVYSKSAKLVMGTSVRPTITTQPLSYEAGYGAKIYFKVKATGALSYQWYYRTSSTGEWHKSTMTGATGEKLTVEATKARNGYQYRCVVTNEVGSRYSKIVTLKTFSSQCGDSLTWKLSSSGLLTIGGSGKMYDYDFWDEDQPYTPWRTVCQTAVKRVTFGSGVTYLGDFAFAMCEDLVSVTIPDTVTDCGGAVFYGCSALEEATVGNGLTGLWSYDISWYYGESAPGGPDEPMAAAPVRPNDDDDDEEEEWADYCGFFEGCSSLQKVTLGKGIKYISSEAFLRCSSLTDVYYRGTRSQWDKIEIAYGNTALQNATLHYNAA